MAAIDDPLYAALPATTRKALKEGLESGSGPKIAKALTTVDFPMGPIFPTAEELTEAQPSPVLAQALLDRISSRPRRSSNGLCTLEDTLCRMHDEAALVARGAAGDRKAFDSLIAPHLPRLRSFLLRLVNDPQDAEDLVQETTLQAYGKLSQFRGESSFGTWLFSIGSRLGLTHLRSRKRWAVTTQLDMHERCHQDEGFVRDLGGEIGRPDFHYEVSEHVAYCFSCVARALDPEESAAVILTEVFEVPNAEAARILGLSESTLRHRLTSGRRVMVEAFEGLCALVNKRGACNQCSTLRDVCPPDRRGPEVPELATAKDGEGGQDARFVRRLAVVRSANVVDGPTASLHAVMLRFIAKSIE